MNRKKWISACVMLALVCVWGAAVFAASESKYATGTTSAAVTFGPTRGRTTVTTIYASSDKLNSVVKVYAKGSAGKTAVTAAPTNGQTVIYIANASYAATGGYTTNDHVVYKHRDGTCDYATVSAATATNITLSSGVSQAGTTSDYVYEVTQQAEYLVGFYGTGSGTNDALNLTGEVFTGPGDSPVYVVLDGTAHAKLNVTAKK